MSQSQFYTYVLAVLRKAGVPYFDCDGNLVGDCNAAPCPGGGGGGGPTTNAVAFNQATSTLTSTVNGVSTSVVLTLLGSRVVTDAALTVNGVAYPAGTPLQTIITAMSAAAHSAAVITQSAAPFSWNTATQTGNIPATPSITDAAGSFAFNPGDGSPSTVITMQEALQFQDEGTNLGTSGTVTSVNFTGAGVTATRVGNALTVNVPTATALTPTTNDFLNLAAGNTVTLSSVPSPSMHVLVYRNGVKMRSSEYSTAGTVITFTTPFGVSGGGAATEDVEVLYYV